MLIFLISMRNADHSRLRSSPFSFISMTDEGALPKIDVGIVTLSRLALVESVFSPMIVLRMLVIKHFDQIVIMVVSGNALKESCTVEKHSLHSLGS